MLLPETAVVPNETRHRKAADERIAFRMDRRNLSADGIGEGHEPSLFCCPLSQREKRLRVCHSAAAGVTSASSIDGGTRFGASFSSAIRASFSRAS